MYAFGQGIAADPGTAYFWLALAENSGLARAAAYRAIVEAQLAPEALARARTMLDRHLHKGSAVR